QQKANVRESHQQQVSWNLITPKQEDFNTSMVVLKSVSVVLEVAFNEMASGKVEKRDGSKEGVHDYDRISRDHERHQDYGGECWVILMGHVMVRFSGSLVSG
nr:hypothetical protein [Tanacetum cinerariifolium]